MFGYLVVNYVVYVMMIVLLVIVGMGLLMVGFVL